MLDFLTVVLAIATVVAVLITFPVWLALGLSLIEAVTTILLLLIQIPALLLSKVVKRLSS